MDRAYRLLLVGRAVERRHAHAAESDRRDLRSIGAELALVHLATPLSLKIVLLRRGTGDARARASGYTKPPRPHPSATRSGHNVAMFPLNLPNVLTVVRIMLVPVLVVALLGNTPAGDVLAAVVFALASLTDFVDGYLARARDSITTFGKLMDPLADKLLIVAALVSLVSLHRLAAWVAMVDHHARAGSHRAAPRRDAGRRRDVREHVRQGQDVPADRRHPRRDRRPRHAAVGLRAALPRPCS